MSVSLQIVNSCKDCSAKCCRGLAVVLTIPEAKRLVESLDAPAHDFLEFSHQVDSKQTPHYPLLVRKGKKVEEYFIVIKREWADCIFLEKDCKCAIYENRPHVCRLYPFELDGKGMKKKALCPVIFEREDYVDGVAAQLKEDLKEHGKIARSWAVRYGHDAPDMRRFGEYFG